MTIAAPVRPPAPARRPDRVIVRSTGRFDMVLKITVTILTCALGFMLLIQADGSNRDVGHDTTPLVLLAISYMGLIVVLTLSSLSGRIQLGIQMLAIYCTVYLILPGYHHMSINTFPFYGMHYDRAVRTSSAIIVLAFIASALGSYTLFHFRSGAILRQRIRSRIEIEPNMALALLLTFLAFLTTIIYLRAVGFSGAFHARANFSDVFKADTALASGFALALPRAVTAASFIYAVIAVRFGPRRPSHLVLLGANVLLFLTTNWPLALARFVLFGYILILGLLIFDFRKQKARILLPLLFVMGALVVMPVFDAFSRGHGQESVSFGALLDTYFGSGDFDGVQSINNAVIYHRAEGNRNGRQLVSAALFFVPRALWHGKGDPTGSLTAEAAGFKFLNISQPLPSEFYVDFGFPGVVLGGILIGFILARFDDWIDLNWDRKGSARLLAGILVGYSIIVYRGSLLAVVAPIATMLVLATLIVKVGLRKTTQVHIPYGARG